MLGLPLLSCRPAVVHVLCWSHVPRSVVCIYILGLVRDVQPTQVGRGVVLPWRHGVVDLPLVLDWIGGDRFLVFGCVSWMQGVADGLCC